MKAGGNVHRVGVGSRGMYAAPGIFFFFFSNLQPLILHLVDKGQNS